MGIAEPLYDLDKLSGQLEPSRGDARAPVRVLRSGECVGERAPVIEPARHRDGLLGDRDRALLRRGRVVKDRGEAREDARPRRRVADGQQVERILEEPYALCVLLAEALPRAAGMAERG